MHGEFRKRVAVIRKVEANISDDGTLSLQGIVAMAHETVAVDLDSGKAYIHQQAWYSGLAQLGTGEEPIRVKLEALTSHEEPALCSKRAGAAEGASSPPRDCGHGSDVAELLHAFTSAVDCWRLCCCLRRRSRSMDARSTRLMRV